jgi:pimeloyl-ACP methyl ester carboxylesterase
VTDPYYLSYSADAWKPNFLGREQPFGIYVPTGSPPAAGWSLTILLHAINFDHNEFGILNSSFIDGLCEKRRSICVAPLGRGADGWWANEAEEDVWEVWNRAAAAYPLDASRTVLAGYSMGGYGAYRIGLEHPDLFAADLVLAGAPACSVRVVQGVELSVVPGLRDCETESDTTPLIGNARELPFYIGTDAGDELAPATASVQQAQLFDAQGYRYRLEIYDDRDHASWAANGTFEGALAWLRRGDFKLVGEPAQVRYWWYAEHENPGLGIGPGTIYWLTDLRARSHAPGFVGSVSAVSNQLALSTPTVRRSQGAVVNHDGPAEYQDLDWVGSGPGPSRSASLALNLSGVQQLEMELRDAGFSPGTSGTIAVSTDGPTLLTISQLRPGTRVTSLGDVQRANGQGRARVTLRQGNTTVEFGEQPPSEASLAAASTSLPNTSLPSGSPRRAMIMLLLAVLMGGLLRTYLRRPRSRP